MISVIVPVYNVEKYLDKCVESIVNQTYKELEIILVDDGSTDNCPAMCDEWAKKDSRIKVIHKENGGLSNARNVGLDFAKGEYITFVDSDDYLFNQSLEKMLKALEEYEADISMVSSISVDHKGNVLSENILLRNAVYFGEEIVEEFVIPLNTSVWNKMFRSNCIDNYKFPSGKVHGEDLVFFTQLIGQKTKLVTTDYIGYCYKKNPNSITTSGFSTKRFDEVACKDIAYENLVSVFPKFKEQALVWKFKSRLNLLNTLFVIDCNDFNDIEEEYECWLKYNIKTVHPYLSKKIKIEYFALKHFKKLYVLIYRFFRRQYRDST